MDTLNWLPLKSLATYHTSHIVSAPFWAVLIWVAVTPSIVGAPPLREVLPLITMERMATVAAAPGV